MNAAGADWCSLCASPLGGVATEPPLAVATEERPPPPSDGPETEAPTPSEPTADGWACPRCSATNPVAVDVCETCGSSIFEAFGAGEERRRDRTRAAERAWVPGAGHHALGDGATAAMVVAVLALTLGLGALVLTTSALTSVGLFCLVAAGGVWAAAWWDVRQRLAGQPSLLTPGRLLYTALGLLVVVAASVIAVARA